MRRKAANPFAVIFVLLFVLMVIPGCQQADVKQSSAVDETGSTNAAATTGPIGNHTTASEEPGVEARNGESAGRLGETGGRAGKGQVRAGDARVGGNTRVKSRGGSPAGRVVLKILGAPGTRFSGTCAVGGEERDVSGQAPDRFVYEPEGREVTCEIRSVGSDAAPLKFSVTAGSKSQKQRIKATGDDVSFSFSGDTIFYSSSSNSGSVVQKSRITSSSYSSSTVSSASTE